MQSKAVLASVSSIWDESIVSTLSEYIKIPNVSPVYDPGFSTNGHIEKVIDLFVDWVKKQNIPELHLEVLKDEGRSPLISISIPASKESTSNDTILLYGHCDKQPPLTESWEKGLGPYTPVIRDGKLYGRGSSDDGYALFSAISAIKTLKSQGGSHPKLAIIIESGEESGSPDLPYYMKKLSPQLGSVGLIVCLDSGCGNYEQFWLTTSLRGIAEGTLKIKILENGVHSGDASGCIPSTFRIARLLLDRLEDSQTGKILLPDLYADIPPKRVEEAKQTAQFLGDQLWNKQPFLPGSQPVTKDGVELLLNRTWRPQLEVIGADGFPSCSTAGNVLRPETHLQLSVRLPPTIPSPKACQAIKQLLEKDPPYGAQVTFQVGDPADGWESPILADWLEQSIHTASQEYWGKSAALLGEGGSIPFMAMLGEQFPQAQFVITGVLGPNSNAHGPNEFLDIEYAKKVTSCVAHIIQDFDKAKRK